MRELFITLTIIAMIMLSRRTLLSPLGIFSIFTIYYAQPLYLGEVEYLSYLPKSYPSIQLYFFYSILMIVIIFLTLLPCRSKYYISVNVTKLKFIRTIYVLQSIVFFALTTYFFYTYDIYVFDKYTITIVSIQTIPLFVYSSFSIVTINSILKEKKISTFIMPIVVIIFAFFMFYRGTVVELILIYIISDYTFNKKNISNWYVMIAIVLGVVVTTPMKYIMAVIGDYLFVSHEFNFHVEDLLNTYYSGNEGGAQLGVAELIIHSKNIVLPDFYFITAFAQHLPFIRQIFNIKRIDFNSLYQEQVFGQLDYGTASSPVAQAYLIAGFLGFIGLLVLVIFILRYRPNTIYLLIIYITALPQFLFLFHRVDFDQFAFVISMCFYVSIIPFLAWKVKLCLQKNNYIEIKKIEIRV